RSVPSRAPSVGDSPAIVSRACSPRLVVAHNANGRLPAKGPTQARRRCTSPAAARRARLWYTLTRDREPTSATSTSTGIQGHMVKTRRISLEARRRRTATTAFRVTRQGAVGTTNRPLFDRTWDPLNPRPQSVSVVGGGASWATLHAR